MHLSMVGHLGTIVPIDTGEVMMGDTDILSTRGLELVRLPGKYINTW